MDFNSSSLIVLNGSGWAFCSLAFKVFAMQTKFEANR